MLELVLTYNKIHIFALLLKIKQKLNNVATKYQIHKKTNSHNDEEKNLYLLLGRYLYKYVYLNLIPLLKIKQKSNNVATKYQ
jgi:hypothetical protein